jgi:hypothetical protein
MEQKFLEIAQLKEEGNIKSLRKDNLNAQQHSK